MRVPGHRRGTADSPSFQKHSVPGPGLGMRADLPSSRVSRVYKETGWVNKICISASTDLVDTRLWRADHVPVTRDGWMEDRVLAP